jgi:GTP-binding protein
MFVDKVRIYVNAGNGGDGCVSFKHEKFIPKGGPNGGNGGKGGSIYLRISSQLTTLLDLTYHPHYKAGSGHSGQGNNKNGSNASDLVVYVPCGTVVYEVAGKNNRQFVADLKLPEQKIMIAKGGRGGRGNASFKTGRNKEPRFAEKGEPGETAEIDLELKLIADVGIIGCPNAGKSTLLARITSARPKIASYPFTTLSPNLGVVAYKEKNFVVADIPGLIEGAHSGRGLGNEFLRHIERTRLLVHMVDIFGYKERTARENFNLINSELKKHSLKLYKKKMITVLNKKDLTGAKNKLAEFRKKIRKKVYPVSAVTGEGVEKILDEILRLLNKPVKEKGMLEEIERKYVFEPEFSIKKYNDVFLVEGKKVETFVAMTNFDQSEAVSRLQNIFKKIGLERMLQKKGIKEGNTVKIGKYEFTYKS